MDAPARPGKTSLRDKAVFKVCLYYKQQLRANQAELLAVLVQVELDIPHLMEDMKRGQ